MTWDDSGKLTVSADWGTVQIAQALYTYDADGKCTEYDIMTPPPNSSLYVASGVPAVTKYQYNADGLVSEVDSYDSGYALLRYIAYTYNDAGKIKDFTYYDTVNDVINFYETFTYDSLGRISSVDMFTNQNGTLADNGTITMTYDSNGSITAMSMTGSYPQEVTMTYAEDTGLLTKISMTSSGTTTTYSMEWQELE